MEKTYTNVISNYLTGIKNTESNTEKLEYLDYMGNSTKYFRSELNKRVRKSNENADSQNINLAIDDDFVPDSIEKCIDKINIVTDSKKIELLQNILTLIESYRKQLDVLMN